MPNRPSQGRFVRWAVATGYVAVVLGCSRNDDAARSRAVMNSAVLALDARKPVARFYDHKSRLAGEPIVFDAARPQRALGQGQDCTPGAHSTLIPLATRTPVILIPTIFSARALLLSWTTPTSVSEHCLPGSWSESGLFGGR